MNIFKPVLTLKFLFIQIKCSLIQLARSRGPLARVSIRHGGRRNNVFPLPWLLSHLIPKVALSVIMFLDDLSDGCAFFSLSTHPCPQPQKEDPEHNQPFYRSWTPGFEPCTPVPFEFQNPTSH